MNCDVQQNEVYCLADSMASHQHHAVVLGRALPFNRAEKKRNAAGLVTP
jgi:hypothetical protein